LTQSVTSRIPSLGGGGAENLQVWDHVPSASGSSRSWTCIDLPFLNSSIMYVRHEDVCFLHDPASGAIASQGSVGVGAFGLGEVSKQARYLFGPSENEVTCVYSLGCNVQSWSALRELWSGDFSPIISCILIMPAPHTACVWSSHTTPELYMSMPASQGMIPSNPL
jgi:hypothetical protein